MGTGNGDDYYDNDHIVWDCSIESKNNEHKEKRKITTVEMIIELSSIICLMVWAGLLWSSCNLELSLGLHFLGLILIVVHRVKYPDNKTGMVILFLYIFGFIFWEMPFLAIGGLVDSCFSCEECITPF